MTKSEIMSAVILLAAQEVLALFIFSAMRKKFETGQAKAPFRSVFKGILERITLFCGLAAGIQTIVVFFGALKIATRLDQDKTKISNDYFLIGNMSSILLVIASFAMYRPFSNVLFAFFSK